MIKLKRGILASSGPPPIPPGATWTTQTNIGSLAFGDPSLQAGNGVFMALMSSQGPVRVSTNGITWTTGGALTGAAGSNRNIAYGNADWLGYKSDPAPNRGYWYRSTNNGSSWSTTVPFVASDPQAWDGAGVAYGNGVWFVGAFMYAALPVMGYEFRSSTNGTTWTTVSQIRRMNPNEILSISFANGRFFVGASNQTVTSTNLTTWTTITGYSIRQAVFGNGVWRAVTRDNASLLGSTNGTTWTTVLSSQFPLTTNLYFDGGVFVAARSTGMQYSLNGSTWTTATGPGAERAVGKDNVWVGTSSNGVVVRST